MAHIHTLPGQHDLTASAFIVRTDSPQPRILLHMHLKLQRWMQMGGHVELHETPWAAVIREIYEESGYNLAQLTLLQPDHTITEFGDRSVPHPMPFMFGTHPFGTEEAHYHTDVTFVLTTKEEPAHQVGDDESTTFKLFTREEILTLPPEQILQNVRVAALHIFDHVLHEWDEVDPQAYSTATVTPKIQKA